jgi:hypothetical protein
MVADGDNKSMPGETIVDEFGSAARRAFYLRTWVPQATLITKKAAVTANRIAAKNSQIGDGSNDMAMLL